MKAMVLLFAAMAAALSGCASAPKNSFSVVSESELAGFRAAPVWAVTVEPGAGLAHYTSAEQVTMTTGMMFGAIGGAIGAIAATSSASRRGAKVVEEMEVPDPSLLVAERLRQRLSGEAEPGGADDPRVVLKTTHWVLQSGNLGYYVELRAHAAGTERMVAKGECKYLRKLSELEVVEDDLFEASAAGLKGEYARAAEYCADYFMTAVAGHGTR